MQKTHGEEPSSWFISVIFQCMKKGLRPNGYFPLTRQPLSDCRQRRRSQADDRRLCLQSEAAEPPSSACFARRAAAFYIAAYGSARSLLQRATDGRAIFLRSLRELRCRILHCDLRFCLQLCCSARNLYRNCPASAGLQFFS